MREPNAVSELADRTQTTEYYVIQDYVKGTNFNAERLYNQYQNGRIDPFLRHYCRNKLNGMEKW